MAVSWGGLRVAFPARVALVLAGELGPGALVLAPTLASAPGHRCRQDLMPCLVRPGAGTHPDLLL